jgi:N-acetylmuramoyl-L-alanine amidase CwlA
MMIFKQIAYNRSTRTQPIKYIVIHDTGNRRAGADAQSHFNYFNSGNRDSSADFFVDDKDIWQVNDYAKYYTWHCGDGKGKYGITNQNSIGVEMCINSDGDYENAYNNLIEVTKYLMDKLNITADYVVRHYDASRKNCPQTFTEERWNDFKARIKGETPMIYNYIDENMPEWAREAVQWAADNGIVKGDGKGLNLDDKDLKVIVWLYRAFKVKEG